MPQTLTNSRSVSPVSNLKRRLVSGKEWKGAINEMSEGQREVVLRLRAIRKRYPNDADTQRDVAAALDEITDIIITLNELLHYRDAPAIGAGRDKEAEKEANGNGQ